MKQRTYIAIDLKSFYASVECRERNLDPLDTNLVVADERRTDKTICLAVTPSLKSYGSGARGAAPCTERSDAKQPEYSCVWAACLAERTYRACPCIEVRPLFQRELCISDKL